MDLLEYRSKKLFAEAGISVPKGLVVDNGIDAGKAFLSLGFTDVVVKSQVPAGGRGLSGGVRFVHSSAEAESTANELIGSRLVTSQTGSSGLHVKQLLLEELVKAEKEFYLAITIDRSLSSPLLVFSQEGGRSIEEVAGTYPDKVYKESIDPLSGLNTSKVMDMAASSGINHGLAGIIKKVYALFLKLDALLIEINPLVFTGGRFVALDAKVVIDDNALFRHPEFSHRTEIEEDFPELKAKDAGISYVRLEGDAGCLANGAGLAMATMDMIRLTGRKPANFLDIGGSAHHEQVSAALSVLLSDPRVKVVFINIFGGIIHCDLIAREIVEALRSMQQAIPIVIRLEGTDARKGRTILEDSGLPITMVSDMEEGMEKMGRWGYL